ncbi:MAG: camphor resistance protein CrcB [Arenimonas sp. SCN 70-307]|uniref:fluoride efflux transporter CrcB n=1 Tax=Arenimonas sp. SCN 70-307 TaxID=1660089 RepID=UPI00086D3C0E|nr:fluoride efflux transporter CrcB [Arenimonas sp. SCN 70-307]ODS62255.1 MAG: camphor resistance protein CrcB [Arenimonas sp. SCN 70-307]
MNWPLLGMVMAGGALGAGARHLMGAWLLRQLGTGLPWGTLAVNLLGSFLAGFIVVWLQERGEGAMLLRGFLVVGLLGGFTTYSALMLECLLYAREGRSGQVMAYLALTLVAGLALVWAGARLAQWLRPV